MSEQRAPEYRSSANSAEFARRAFTDQREQYFDLGQEIVEVNLEGIDELDDIHYGPTCTVGEFCHELTDNNSFSKA